MFVNLFTYQLNATCGHVYMFYDWLTIFQDHDQTLPFLGDTVEVIYDTQTKSALRERQPAFVHKGSFSTSIIVRISGTRVTMKGNPSRVGRIDNLFGFSTVDQCVDVYNKIIEEINATLPDHEKNRIPPFTKCTSTYFLSGKDGDKALEVSNGATIQELHITSNKAVGKNNETDYLKAAISTQRYRNSIPRLHSNGTTVDWLSPKGNASLIYASVYIKAHEIALHSLGKIKKLHGSDSEEFFYLSKVHDFCRDAGVVRFEQKLKSRFLRRNRLQFWGLSDYSILNNLHSEFLNIDKTVQVNAMTYQAIAEVLKEEGICKSTQAANSTANYFFMWLHGQRFDLKKSQVKIHRARLRKINIDIAESCDIDKHSPVRIKEVREVEVSILSVPDWYQKPVLNHLKLVA